MPWKGVTVSEQRQRFLEDYQLNYYSITEFADRFSISRTTAHKWIKRYKEYGQSGFHECSRRPHSCPWQTEAAIVEEVVGLRKAHPRWGPSKLLDLMDRRDPRRELPSVSTAARILSREGLVKRRRRYRRAHPGCPQSQPQGPNDICLHLVALSGAEGPALAQRARVAPAQVGRRLQGAVSPEEREVLLPADGQRPGHTLRTGGGCAPGDLAGKGVRPFQAAF